MSSSIYWQVYTLSRLSSDQRPQVLDHWKLGEIQSLIQEIQGRHIYARACRRKTAGVDMVQREHTFTKFILGLHKAHTEGYRSVQATIQEAYELHEVHQE